MTASPSATTSMPAADSRARWFDDIVAELRVDELQLETGTAPREKESRYEALISGNPERLLLQQQELVTQHFVTKLVVDFILLSRPHWKRIARIAATANDSEVLFWIELREEDELLEDQLTDVEARVNAKYHSLGYDLELMIVEEEDGLEVPSHYTLIHPNPADEPVRSAPQAGQ